MTKQEILNKIEKVVANENNLAVLSCKLYDLNFAYNRLLAIERKGCPYKNVENTI